jgi:hypothetical protein
MKPQQDRGLGSAGRVPAVVAVTIVAAVVLAAVGGPRAVGSGPKSKRKSRPAAAAPSADLVSTPMVVLGFNDLGMHCMNPSFSELCLLPPYNTMHAQVIDRSGEDPRIVTSGVQVRYSIPGNTHSVGKTDFWTFAQALFGLKSPLPANIGLTGHGLSGSMTANPADGDWSVTGIPLTPVTDTGVNNPFQLSAINVTRNGGAVASTRAVVPVSWEISCNLCHTGGPGVTVESDILMRHDRLHGTRLMSQKPVLCASCHADPALSAAGKPGIKPLSIAMHGAHAPRMAAVNGKVPVSCYACHPGKVTECLRDVHFSKGMNCINCHGTEAAVGNPSRRPWVDEPRCGTCHTRAGFQFEEPGKLYKESHGHNGVKCASCHGSPHAITPTVIANDNVQAINVQGHAGTINDCRVCHRNTPDDRFNHSLGGD